MPETKPLASLSSSLLARKGQASPAMRRQGMGGLVAASAVSADDLGWNDMGNEARENVLRMPIAPAPESDFVEESAENCAAGDIVPISPELGEPVAVEPVVHAQQEEIAQKLTTKVKSRALPGGNGKAAFTLRLDPERHLRLRLACAVSHRSAQMLVVEALDAFLDSRTDVAALATIATNQR